MPDYNEWQVAGNSIGGGMEMQPSMKMPPHWLVYFAVKSVDETAERAKELGGTINMSAMDIPDMGRFAVLSDPQGAAFAVFAP